MPAVKEKSAAKRLRYSSSNYPNSLFAIIFVDDLSPVIWLPKLRPRCAARHARGQKLCSFQRDWDFCSVSYSVLNSELSFHIWNANSYSFAGAKSEAKMAAHGGKFWTSVSVLFAVLYVSSSPLHDFSLKFLFGSASKTFPTMEKVFRRNTTGPILHNRVFKRIHYRRVA